MGAHPLVAYQPGPSQADPHRWVPVRLNPRPIHGRHFTIGTPLRLVAPWKKKKCPRTIEAAGPPLYVKPQLVQTLWGGDGGKGAIAMQ